MGQLSGLVLPIAFLVIFYFLLIRPQRKKDKEIKEMRANLKVGDKITTIGGIYGKIIKIKDEDVIIENAEDRVKFKITKWAVGKVLNKKSTSKTKPSKTDKKVKNDKEDNEEKENNKDIKSDE